MWQAIFVFSFAKKYNSTLGRCRIQQRIAWIDLWHIHFKYLNSTKLQFYSTICFHFFLSYKFVSSHIWMLLWSQRSLMYVRSFFQGLFCEIMILCLWFGEESNKTKGKCKKANKKRQRTPTEMIDFKLKYQVNVFFPQSASAVMTCGLYGTKAQ